jgi:tRNA (guanine37-N1)-methyltransferase
MSFNATIITLFPDVFPGVLGASLPGQALVQGVWQLHTLQLRDFATDKHHKVDDVPYGGGAGMVLKPDVVSAAVQAARTQNPNAPVVYMSPRGAPLTQARAQQFAAGNGIIILCGRYEGVDQRVLDAERIEEVSIGDYVLAGGEVAAMVLLEAITRLLPGTVGNAATHDEESFAGGLLEYPHFTRPAEWTGPDGQKRVVPEVLTGGNHAAINAWRRAQAEDLTRNRRPDLFVNYMKNKDK